MNTIVKRSLCALMLLALAMGAVAAQMGEEEPKKDEPKAIDPPFKIDEVKKTFKKGLKVKYKTVMSPMKDVTHKGWLTLEVTEMTEGGFKYDMVMKTEEIDGKKAEGDAAKENTSHEEQTWEGFWRRHDLKEKVSTYTEEKLKVGAGEYDCKVLTETVGNDETIKMTQKYWYIKDRPGIFAKMEVTVVEVADGKKTTHTDSYELVEIK